MLFFFWTGTACAHVSTLMSLQDSANICVLLNICPSSSSSARPHPRKDSAVEQNGCELCKLVVGYLDQLLDSNKTEAEVRGEVKALCSYLGSIAQEVQDTMNTS